MRERNTNPQGDNPGSGPWGYCICPSCGYKTAHIRATPCNQIKCPKCRMKMTRK